MPTQPLIGVTTRIVRRLGGAVRNAIAGRLSLAGALRRPTASQTHLGHTLAEDADARPDPGQAPRAPHPRTVPAAPPSHLAKPNHRARRLFRTSRRHRAPATPAPFSPDDNSPFTPENMPGLLPEAAAFFNTPLEDLDPVLLQFSLRAFAEKLVELLPPETGLADADALFADLRARFAGLLDEPAPDTAPPETPPTPADPMPPAQRASSTAPPPPSPLAPPEASSPVLLSALPPSSEAQAPHPPNHPATIVAAVPPAALDTAPVSPDRPQSGAHINSFRLNTNHHLFHRCRRLLQACRAAFRRFLVPTRALRHWHYAARASPA
ncbi:MAG TPA: hypothetical protein VMB73_01760 [Acetobacteraceae bacterium]|nr:hypothetical protein [Acetobacteraceae bacterium]